MTTRPTQQGHLQLAAYVVVTDDNQLSEQQRIADLRAHLTQRLPDYMLPTHLRVLSTLPLNRNGKVDYAALPQLDVNRLQAQPHVAPSTQEERSICKIWIEVLRVERIGIDDNFFELGGDSILAIRVAMAMNQAGLQIHVRSIFEHPTIRELASHVCLAHRHVALPVQASGPTPLTPIQHWLFEEARGDIQSFHQSVVIQVQAGLNTDRLNAAFDDIITHHDALRLSFENQDGWKQTLREEFRPLQVETFCCRSFDANALKNQISVTSNELHRSMDLSAPPLLRVAHFDCGNTRNGRLLIVAHHLVVDAVSWQVLLSDLAIAYECQQNSQPVDLPTASSFAGWARALERHAKHQDWTDELQYWMRQIGKAARDTELILGHPRKVASGNEGEATEAQVILDQFDTEKLMQSDYATNDAKPREILLTAVVDAISELTGRDELLVDVEGHGREPIDDGIDATRSVGWYTTVFPVLLDLLGAVQLSEALEAVKAQLRDVPRHGISYGVLRYLHPDAGIRNRLASAPSATVLFNYLGRVFDTDPPGRPWTIDESSSLPRTENVIRRYLIEINVQVIQGTLVATFTYTAPLIPREAVEGVCSRFHETLRKLIAECRGDSESVWQ